MTGCCKILSLNINALQTIEKLIKKYQQFLRVINHVREALNFEINTSIIGCKLYTNSNVRRKASIREKPKQIIHVVYKKPLHKACRRPNSLRYFNY